jgi:hypothetical protein
MAKKTAVSISFSFLIGFLLLGGFQSYLLADSTHVVNRGELREAITASSQARLAKIEKLESRFSQWGIDTTQVKMAVRTLTNAELEYLVQQSENAAQNLFGGDEILGDAGNTVGLIVMASVAAFIVAWQVFTLTAGSGNGY